MKNLTTFLFLFISCIITGCSRSDSSDVTESITKKPVSKAPAKEAGTTAVFDIPTIKTLFITTSGRSFIYEKPDTQSVILDTLEYGYKIDIIGESENWYQIKERVGRSFVKNGKQVFSSGWEIVNIQKENTGTLSKIKLTAPDLYKTYEGNSVKDKVQMRIISKKEFDSTRSSTNKFLTTHNSAVSSKDSVITIAVGNGLNKVYVSSPNAEENLKVYKYIGHIDLLNAYLLTIDYYEGTEYMLYNAGTGKELISFNDYPYISPDGKYIVSVYTNPYDQTTDFQLYTITNNQKIRRELETSFSNWMVALEPQEVFWKNNSTLVMKVLHAKAFWNENGDLNKNYQYLEMELL